MSNDIRFLIVASTSGSVMNQALKNSFFRSHVHSIVVDQECSAIEKGVANGVHVEKLIEKDEINFSMRLLEYANHNNIDYVFTFYTKFFHKIFRGPYQDRIINFHPSILPAFKGMDGFGDQIRYHVKLIGATVEFIDQKMDEGKIIMQHCFPFDPNIPEKELRHRLFVQQCKSILQVAKWLVNGRVEVDGRKVIIRDARYDSIEFSPALGFIDAINLSVPLVTPRKI